MVHDNSIQFLHKGFRFKVYFLIFNIVFFKNVDKVSEELYVEARRTFIEEQEKYNLQGLVDPESDVYESAR